MKDLERKFHDDMIQIYRSAKSLKYNASYFIQMVTEKGGYAAAKQLIHTDTPSAGFVKLWELHRLDLSVEALVVKPEYTLLFTDEERQICQNRLCEYGYVV